MSFGDVLMMVLNFYSSAMCIVLVIASAGSQSKFGFLFWTFASVFFMALGLDMAGA